MMNTTTSNDRRRTRYTKRTPAAPERINLHTEALADERRHARRKRDDAECAQFLRIQQKLTGKKTTEEYARIRLVRRQDETARKKNLHQNVGKQPATAKVPRPSNQSGTVQLADTHDLTRIHPLTAREPSRSSSDQTTDQVPRRVRPQSAKPVLQSTTATSTPSRESGVTGRRVSVGLLERCYYNPVPLTAHLAASRSTPRLRAALQHSQSALLERAHAMIEASASVKALDADQAPAIRNTQQFTDVVEEPGRRHIVVYMQHLGIQDDDDSSSDGDEIVTVEQPTNVQRGARRTVHTSQRLDRNQAWGD